MPTLTVRLFGKFSARHREQTLDGLDASKVQELLSYLLVRRDRPHPREALASLLWGDATTEKSKKYLRQALWHLQNALSGEEEGEADSLLTAEHDWVQLRLGAEVWLDVAAFEGAYTSVRDRAGRDMSAQDACALQEAVRLYRGDLLEGWYQDWCLFERERLQNIYLSMLHKLMGYCGAHCEYETGQHYGSLILGQDRASERTHRHLMYLHYAAGDRTAALRQYERCVAALEEELGVGPDGRTVRLYEQIRADHLQGEASAPAPQPAPQQQPTGLASLPEMLGRLRQLQDILSDVQQRVQHDIREVELALKQKAHRATNR
ncbi:MAG TPA: bacterial transcriptional activator domain-containing protein [Pyrinomonadaceae bacterium]|nr:bacterial transcriptional activator domain-containing protein [Pyrinomonadaceae bacterium]